MRRLLVSLLGLALLTSASSQLPALGSPPPATAFGDGSVGCVGAAASFTGQAYCLDGDHASVFRDTQVYRSSAALAASAAKPAESLAQIVGTLELNGWQVPTRCDGNGTSGKREQLVYVHIKGAPDIYTRSLGYLTQRLIPGANGVYEHTTNGKRAIRWVTRKTATGCAPTIIKVTVPAADNHKGKPYINIASDVLKATGGFRPDRSYLLLVDQDDGYCGLGQTRMDSRAGTANVNNLGGAFALVWKQCWTGLVAAHELTHTLGAVQPGAPHHTTNGHCWDGKDDMCYPDGSPQQQKLICKKPDDYRKLDCHGDDYFALFPKPGSYLATHWNSAASPFLINSKPKVLPHRPATPKAVTVTRVDAGHVRVSWLPGPPKRGGVTSYTVQVNVESGGLVQSENGKWNYGFPQSLVKVGKSVRSVLVAATTDPYEGFAVIATNASGDSYASRIVQPAA